MPGMSRKNVDSAGGTLINPPLQDPLGDFCFVEGSPACVLGQTVTGHGLPPHSSASMITASLYIKVAGVGVVRSGDTASCGHVANGSTKVFAD